MKTCYFEQRKKSAKLFHKNNQQCTHYKNGILIRHLYSDKNKNTLSWWDDVGFILNDYRVSIAWIHPRQAFWDYVHNLAIDIVLETDHEQELNSIRLSEMQTPIYKKIGRSRKKIKLYEHNFLPDNGYIDALKQTEQEIAATTDFVVVPSLDISWTNHSRFVSACLPFEICNEHDLRMLVYAQKHYLIKLPRGRDSSDIKILRNEAAFIRTANALGLFVEEIPQLHEDMLFIPRFDRKVTQSGVERLHQESAASLVGQIGFDQRPSQNELLAALRRYVTNKTATTIEFIKRDILNLAMGNTDNHARNTAVQIVDGVIQLSPLFDFAPMNLDKEGIARALRWKNKDKNNVELNNWVDVLASLDLEKHELAVITDALYLFGQSIEGLPDIMAQQGVDSDIIENRYYAIQTQIKQLRELKVGGSYG